jgi:hypothetical protein
MVEIKHPYEWKLVCKEELFEACVHALGVPFRVLKACGRGVGAMRGFYAW